MNINLSEHEIKDAITEYLSKRLVKAIGSTDITLTAGRAPNGMTASVDIDFITSTTSVVKEIITEADITPVGATSDITVKKVVSQKASSAPAAKTESQPEVDSNEIMKEVTKDLGAEASFKTPVDETPVVTEKVVEAPIVEGGNTMTKNFDLAKPAGDVAAPVDDVEDLFA